MPHGGMVWFNFASEVSVCNTAFTGSGLYLGEGTPLFSRPYLYSEGEVTQYLGFKEWVADSQRLKGVPACIA
jgi:hypothetical protein